MKLQSIQNFKSVLQRGLQFSRPAKGNGTQNENILSHSRICEFNIQVYNVDTDQYLPNWLIALSQVFTQNLKH